MEGQAILDLFELRWFTKNVLTKPSDPDRTHLENQDQQKPTVSRPQTRHVRSLSDQSISKPDQSSLDSVLHTRKLDTILSGKAVEDVAVEETKPDDLDSKFSQKMKGKRTEIFCGRSKRASKSLSELEFEEIKGFMDLGFTFSEEEKDPRLVSIIPGLQRFGKIEDSIDESSVSRPYLSEAWDVCREPENPLINWRIPVVTDGNNMKEHLRSWAHTVASSVKV